MTEDLKGKCHGAERRGVDGAEERASSSSSSASSSAAAAAALAAAAASSSSSSSASLAPVSPPRTAGGRELRLHQLEPEEAEAGAAKSPPSLADECERGAAEQADGPAATTTNATPSPSSSSPSSAFMPLLPSTSSPLTEGRPACYLVVHNVSKKHNVGSLARMATAFGVSEVILVGQRQFHAFGAHGSASYVAFRHFDKLSAAKKWLREEKGARLLGVEIDDSAVSVCSPGVFEGSTAFLMGNEGSGLSPAHIAACDGLVYIPHHGSGTASLNVACAAAVVLSRFSEWARYDEAPRRGAKFDVAARPPRNAPRGQPGLDAEGIEALRRARAAKKAAAPGGGGGEEEGEASAASAAVAVVEALTLSSG